MQHYMTLFCPLFDCILDKFPPPKGETSSCLFAVPHLHKAMRLLASFITLVLPVAVVAQIEAPSTEFADYLVAPVHVHRLVTQGELNLTTTLEAKDINRIFTKVNRIWGHAGIHLPVQTITTEAAANPNVYRQNYKSRQLGWMLALRPKTSRSTNQFHVYYLKRFLANGVYIGPGGMFVKDTARLRQTEGGIDEPIPRVTSHELGHALTLKHRQNVTNLLASGTSGWTLNDAEIKQAREAAKKIGWIQTASSILKKADQTYEVGDKKQAKAIYRLIAGIPLHCPETTRAKKRAGLDKPFK